MKVTKGELIKDTLFFIITVIFLTGLGDIGKLTNIQLSLSLCFYFGCSLLYVWSIRGLSPFFMFLALSNILFIGGRFWGVLLNPELELMIGTFFEDSYISIEHLRETLGYVILFIFSASFGYKSCKIIAIDKTLDDPSRNKADSFLGKIWWFIMIFSIYGQVLSLMYALAQGSYLAMYEGQSGGYVVGASLGGILLYVFFGLSMAYGSPNTQKRYLLLFFVYSIINILIGARGTLGAVLMFAIWYYSLSHNINIIKVGLLGLLALVFLLWIFSFSVRQADVENAFSLSEALSYFLYSQGISFAVFDQSRDILDYPTLAYIQSIVPGSSAIYSLISGVSLKPQDVSFASYLSYNLNPILFLNGQGLGWTLLGDLYLFGGRTYLGSILLSWLFGYICSYVERKSSSSMFCKVLVFSIFMRFVLLPRAGLNTIIPFIVYVYVIHRIFVHFFVTGRKSY